MQIGFVGLGSMGGGMALRLLEKGFRLSVHNRTAAKAKPHVAAGARPAATAADAVADADVVIVSLSDETAVERVLFGELLPATRPGVIVIDTSTVSPGYAREAARRVAEAGRRRLETCVVGNPDLARKGALRLLVSGDAADLDATSDVLKALGRQIRHLPKPGMATTMKLVFNSLLGAQVASLAEAVAYGERAGLDSAMLLEAIAESGFSSLVMGFRAQLMREQRYDPAAFRTWLMEKDLRHIVDDAAALGIDLPVLARSRLSFAEVVEAGDGDLDAAVLFRHLVVAS